MKECFGNLWWRISIHAPASARTYLATLYRAGKYGKTKSMFVGIKGGLDKLREMMPEQIKTRKMFLLETKQKSKERIPLADFWRALEEKGFQFD